MYKDWTLNCEFPRSISSSQSLSKTIMTKLQKGFWSRKPIRAVNTKYSGHSSERIPRAKTDEIKLKIFLLRLKVQSVGLFQLKEGFSKLKVRDLTNYMNKFQ